MPGEWRTREGSVLTRRPRGESFLEASLLQDDGTSHRVRFRVSRRSSGSHPPPDLFSRVVVTAEETRQGTYVKEHTVTRGAPKLDYSSLEAATRFALLLEANTSPETEDPEVAGLWERALRGWAGGADPQVVLLKGEYVFLRLSGYPVAEEWRAELPEGLREAARVLLSRSLAEIDPEVAENTRELRTRLERWMEHRTEIRSGA